MEAVIAPEEKRISSEGEEEERAMWHRNASGRGASLSQRSSFSTCRPFRGKDRSVSFKVPYIWCLLADERANAACIMHSFKCSQLCSEPGENPRMFSTAAWQFALCEDAEGFPYKYCFMSGIMTTPAQVCSFLFTTQPGMKRALLNIAPHVHSVTVWV